MSTVVNGDVKSPLLAEWPSIYVITSGTLRWGVAPHYFPLVGDGVYVQVGGASVDSQMAFFRERFQALSDNIGQFIRGKTEVVRDSLVCLFARGHLLIEDVPGVAKTSLAKAIGRSIAGGVVKRIQFTPDLLPSDVTGVQIYDQNRGVFEFRRGPVFANILLGDEINRASPKTQSALLEVMAERQVTVDGAPFEVPDPFLCIATQNPIEHQGTFSLPEAQLDRFMMCIRIGYPLYQDEMMIVANGISGYVPEQLSPMMDLEDVRAMIGIVGQVHVSPALQGYLVRITAATREMADVRLGISPRGTIALAIAAQARAASEGRSFVSPDDIKALTVPVLAHRLLITAEARAQGRRASDILSEVLAVVKVPDAPDLGARSWR
jgi:MoxR-like ATPase